MGAVEYICDGLKVGVTIFSLTSSITLDCLWTKVWITVLSLYTTLYVILSSAIFLFLWWLTSLTPFFIDRLFTHQNDQLNCVLRGSIQIFKILYSLCNIPLSADRVPLTLNVKLSLSVWLSKRVTTSSLFLCMLNKNKKTFFCLYQVIHINTLFRINVSPYNLREKIVNILLYTRLFHTTEGQLYYTKSNAPEHWEFNTKTCLTEIIMTTLSSQEQYTCVLLK